MKKRTILEYSITTGIAIILTLVLLLTKKVFVETDMHVFWKNMVDSFFVTGILILCAGLLVVISDGGAFDFFIYGMGRFFSIFKRDPNKVKYKTYYDYQQAKKDEPHHSFAFLLIIGGVFTAISLLFLIFYYQYPAQVS